MQLAANNARARRMRRVIGTTSPTVMPNDQVNRRPALQPAEEEDAYPGVRLNAMLGSNA